MDCPKCRQPLPEGINNFCRTCGVDLTSAAEIASAPQWDIFRPGRPPLGVADPTQPPLWFDEGRSKTTPSAALAAFFPPDDPATAATEYADYRLGMTTPIPGTATSTGSQYRVLSWFRIKWNADTETWELGDGDPGRPAIISLTTLE